MILFISSILCILSCTFGLTISTPTSEAPPKPSKTQDKRSLLIGDLSYSYSATDIGSEEGSHVKTITVIKNIGAPNFHKHLPPHHPYDGWDPDSKNRFNFVFKFPQFPQIDTGTYFHTEKRRKVIPTKQPTDRQTPVFNTEFDTNDQPNVNVNINNNGPQVFENSPDVLPDPMPVTNTEHPVSKEPSDDVEYIQTDGEKSKLLMPTPAMYHNKKVQATRASTPLGLRTASTNCKTCQQKQLQSQRQTPDFIEDFSDYSMHNVKHIVDPMKVKDSLLKYTQNQSNLDLKKLTNVESNAKDKQFDSYGNVVQKSQSLLDASQPYRNNFESNSQESKRPYLSPSLKKGYSPPPPPTTTSASKGVTFFSTTQKAYVVPKKSKLSENSNPDSSLVKASTETIQQPMVSMQLRNDNRELSQKRNAPLQQLNEDKKPDQQFHSYSIRNPLTTSLPVQHNHHPKLQQGKLQSYVAVPIDADIPSNKHLLTMPKRYVRHQIVFDSKPPHPFMESPFQPVKAILMG